MEYQIESIFFGFNTSVIDETDWISSFFRLLELEYSKLIKNHIQKIPVELRQDVLQLNNLELLKFLENRNTSFDVRIIGLNDFINNLLTIDLRDPFEAKRMNGYDIGHIFTRIKHLKEYLKIQHFIFERVFMLIFDEIEYLPFVNGNGFTGQLIQLAPNNYSGGIGLRRIEFTKNLNSFIKGKSTYFPSMESVWIEEYKTIITMKDYIQVWRSCTKSGNPLCVENEQDKHIILVSLILSIIQPTRGKDGRLISKDRLKITNKTRYFSIVLIFILSLENRIKVDKHYLNKRMTAYRIGKRWSSNIKNLTPQALLHLERAEDYFELILEILE